VLNNVVEIMLMEQRGNSPLRVLTIFNVLGYLADNMAIFGIYYVFYQIY
jgi:hypothetical protein